MASHPPAYVMLSLKPQFADAFLDGTKTVEIRRNRLAAEPGSMALLYAASPRRALVATGTIVEIVHAAADELWDSFGSDTGLGRADFDDYLQGARNPTAIRLRDVATLGDEVELERLRQIVPGFHPPQSWHLLRPAVASMLLAG